MIRIKVTYLEHGSLQQHTLLTQL